jgi:trimethylamine-N-oxide reductase cytochrome c-type subunit TorC
MKSFIKLIAVNALAVSLQATSYVYVEEGVSLPLKDGTVLYSGSPLEVISKTDNFQKVKLSGFVDTSDKTKLYATKNLKLLLIETKSLHVEGNQGSFETELSNDFITEDSEEAWEVTADRFYEKCTQCHAAKVVEEHTMLEWEGLYGSMNEFAKPTKEDTTYILRFLRAYAKDGIVKEVE